MPTESLKSAQDFGKTWFFSWLELAFEGSSGLSPQERFALESNLAEGQSLTPEVEALFNRHLRALPWLPLFRAGNLVPWYRPAAMLEVLGVESTLDVAEGLASEKQVLAQWSEFYRAFAHSRLGNLQQSEACNGRLRQALKTFPDPVILWEMAFEEGRTHMGRGRYKEAIQIFEDLQLSGLDLRVSLYSFFQLQTLHGTCLQAIGRFKESDACLETQVAIEQHFSARIFRLARIRRTSSLLVESEQYERAQRFMDLHQNDVRTLASGSQRVLFVQERLRLAILRGEISEVNRLFEEISHLVIENQLPPSSLNLDEERCEVELRARGNSARMLPIFLERMALNRRRGDVAAECVMLLLLARVYRQQGKLDRARSYGKESLVICERMGFGKTHVRALMVLAGIEKVLGNSSACQVLLAKAIHLAKVMDLPVQRTCGSILEMLLHTGSVPLSLLVRMYAITHSFSELFYYAECYGERIPLRVQFESQHGVAEVALLNETLSIVSGAPCLLWLPDEGLLFEAGVRAETGFRELALRPEIKELFSMAWKQKVSGFSLEEVHATRYQGIAFDSLRHLDSASVALSRFRKFLAPLGVSLRLERGTGCYVMISASPLCAISTLKQIPAKAARAVKEQALTAREREVIDYLRQEGPKSMTQLRERFGVTRQTLHPILKKLEAQGALALKRRGKLSRYVPHSPSES